MSEARDADDVRQARGGDADAFARLVARYARPVHDLARRMLRDATEAEDVAQQAFLNAWRALDRFDLDRPFRNWMLRIASNLCRNRIASRARARVLPPRGGDEVDAPAAPPPVDPAPPPGGDEGTPTAPAALRAALRGAIEQLPEPYRLAVLLHYVHGLPLAAIAEIAEVPVATVKTHLHRGRAQLRARLLPPETPPAAGGTTR